MKMKKNPSLLASILCFSIILGLLSSMGGLVAVDAQYQTPTPDAEGNIYYTVAEGDFCSTIAEKFDVSVQQIIDYNGLDKDCTIWIGRKLLVAKVTAPSEPPTPVPAEATEAPQEPQPTEPPIDVEPSPTAVLNVGRICVVLFHDKNGNAMRDDGESFLYGGEVSINDRLGTVSKVGTTVAGDPEVVTPLCFPELPPGEYNISVAIPDGFNTTTANSHAVTITAGATMTIDFGAQEATPEASQQTEVGSRSPLLFILGGVILLSGLGLLFYMLRTRKN